MDEAAMPASSHSWPPATYLGQLSPDARRLLFAAGTRATYGRDEVLFHEGDPASYLLLILSGLVKVSAASETGQVTLLAIRGPGDVIGELSAADHAPHRSATVAAAVDLETCVVRHQDFVRLTQREPDLMVTMLHVISDKLRTASRARVAVHTYTVRVRLARILLELAHSYGRPGPEGTLIDLPLNQVELAYLVSASSVSVARCLSVFRNAGMIHSGYRQLWIQDMEALSAVAHE